MKPAEAKSKTVIIFINEGTNCRYVKQFVYAGETKFERSRNKKAIKAKKIKLTITRIFFKCDSFIIIWELGF